MGIETSDGKAKYKCANGHYLIYTTDASGYMAGRFSCDVCKNSNDCAGGRYNCPQCKWDFCNTCSNEYKPKPNPVVCCKGGHGLLYTRVDYPMGKYSCDMCHRSYPCFGARWMCVPCQYDICPFCRPPPITNFCPSGHKIEQTGSCDGYTGDVYVCSRCGIPRSFGDGLRWNCEICKYDVCLVCKPPTDDDCCLAGHKIEKTGSSDGYSGDTYPCAKCGQNCSFGDGLRWNCEICKYDVCPKCKPE